MSLLKCDYCGKWLEVSEMHRYISNDLKQGCKCCVEDGVAPLNADADNSESMKLKECVTCQ